MDFSLVGKLRSIISSESRICLLLLCYLLLSFAVKLFADQPPIYRNYNTFSANGKYFAKIYKDSLENNWKLEVFNSDSNFLWRRNYHHSGYESTLLSEDGNCFIYIEYWYRDSTPVVSIYQKDTILYLNGSYFKLNESDLVRTVSHKLWCNSKSFQDSILKIETKDNRLHEVNIYNGKLVSERISMLSGYFKYGLILIIIIIVYRVQRKKNF